MTIPQQQKTETQAALLEYVRGFDSDAKAIATLDGMSQATYIHIRDGKWDNISPEMWRSIAKQVQGRKKPIIETQDFQTCILYYDIAREEGEVFAIIGGPGSGKTLSGTWYAKQMKNRNVYHLPCAAYWNKKYFLIELIAAMGKNSNGMNQYEMMKFIVTELRKMECPLIILDEIDKLKDEVFLFFITFYNELHSLCGIVWTSTDNIEKRLKRGIRLGKPGYQEMFSRIGKNFIYLHGTDAKEVEEICNANGITSREEINKLYNEYEGDLRRVERVILKHKIKARSAA